MTDTELFGWHFTRGDGTTRHLLTRETIGTTYRQVGTIEPCTNGLHGSLRALDALSYANDSTHVRYCRFGGEIVQESDKIAASERTPLYEGNVKSVIRTFAFECADRAVRLHAPAALRSAGMETDAVALESLSPIVDITTAFAATNASNASRAAFAARTARAASDAAGAARTARTASDASDAAAFAARTASDAAGAAGYAASNAGERNWQNTRLETLLRAALNMPEASE